MSFLCKFFSCGHGFCSILEKKYKKIGKTGIFIGEKRGFGLTSLFFPA